MQFLNYIWTRINNSNKISVFSQFETWTVLNASFTGLFVPPGQKKERGDKSRDSHRQPLTAGENLFLLRWHRLFWYVNKKLFLSVKHCATGIKHTHTRSETVASPFPLIRHPVGWVTMMHRGDILWNIQLGSESAESGCVLTGSGLHLGRSA